MKIENSDDFHPVSCSEASEQNYGRPKKQQKYVSGQNNGKWSEIQHAKYIAFIEHNKDKMRSKQKRRVNKLYKQMATYIGTRNALQCRSHHQKLQDRYLYPNKIIANYKLHNDITLYLQLKQQLQELQPKTAANSSAQMKPQNQNAQIACQTEVKLGQPHTIALPEPISTTTSTLSYDTVNSMCLPYGYVPSQNFEANNNWGSYYYYPFYPIY